MKKTKNGSPSLQNSFTAFEERAREKGYQRIAGVDEAGRGPLAGPVVAGACIIPKGRVLEAINDSKKLTAKKRDLFFEEIFEDKQIQCGIGIVSHEVIDEINIYQATIRAMLEAVERLPQKPDYLLVDGLALPHPEIPTEKMIRGDQASQSVMAGAILAKVTRDRLMKKYHEKWPLYGFDKHKGYGTLQHREAILKYGPCPIHRKTFDPISQLL